MHPELSRGLFEEQIQKILRNTDLLLDRGWLFLEWEYPWLAIAVRHRNTRKIRVFKFKFNDWDDVPPSLKLVDAETGEDLPGNMWPTGNQSYWHSGGWISSAGITTTLPFMCMPGIREYHTHQSHTSDHWENYKGKQGFDVVGIVIAVTEVFQNSNV
jgi:hypothetical protein